MMTAQRPAAVPVLTFAAQPGGAPPPVLRAGATGDWALRPAGGEPMLVLRRTPDVLRVLSDSTRFGMAGVTPSGELACCPLTGAELQSPDGGLLNMDPPQLRAYRRRINGLFTRQAAEATRPAVAAIAARLTGALARRRDVDALADFAEPFTAAAVCAMMGVPHRDWDRVAEFSRVAFAVVPGPGAIAGVSAAWQDLYQYYGPAGRRARALPGQLASVLDGHTTSQVVHTIGTVSNGFGAVLPVLAVALAELARQATARAGLGGELDWDAVAARLLRYRAIFPVALPRRALADTRLAGRHIGAGTVVLPSLIGAARDVDTPPPCTIAFGAGPHFCPGAALTRVWLACALAEFFRAFPAARLAGTLDWQPGTLSVPRQIPLALR
jgi:cytochrome P450